MANTQRYREYDLAHLKLVFEFSIYKVWSRCRYGVSNVLDTAYWVFLGAQIRRIFLDGYGVLVVRIVIFKISSFKLQNARLLVKFHKVLHNYCNSQIQMIKLIKLNPTTAKAAWENVVKILLDNKRTRTIALKVILLNDFGSPMSDDDVVTYAIHGLSDKFTHVATIIAHWVPFLDLDTMQSMVTTEEMRLKSKPQTLYANTTSSTPQFLVAETNASRGQDSRVSRYT
ncbi:hypothetical protein Tco_0355856, partial [Tanacetum coccineum]